MIKNLQNNNNNNNNKNNNNNTFLGVGVAKIVVHKCSLKPPRNFHVIRLNGKQP